MERDYGIKEQDLAANQFEAKQFKSGQPVKVRESKEIEEGWEVSEVDTSGGVVSVINREKGVVRGVPAVELRQWQNE